MAIYKDFTTTINISGTQIQLTSQIGSDRLVTTVTRDMSEDTNYAAACVLHKNTALSQAVTATSPPCKVVVRGRWVTQAVSSTVTSSSSTIVVPASNSGILRVEFEDSPILKYKINTGSYSSALTTGATITVVNGDLLYFKAEGLAAQAVAIGGVIDTDTETPLDYFSLLNTTAP